MGRLPLLGVFLFALTLVGCTGGAAGDPSDDIGDIFVLTHSPGNADQLDLEDSINGFNALDNPTLVNAGAVTIVFTNSVLPATVINPDPSDPQGTRNVRLFYFDPTQGPFDPLQPIVPGANPPGDNVIIPATTVLTTTNQVNDTLLIRPTGITATRPMRLGQYSVVVELGVRGADGDGMKGSEYFFFFRVGQDNRGPTYVSSSPAPGELDVDPESEIRVTMSETIQASTVTNANILVNYQPAGAANPISIPGTWFTDGGNGPGNNSPANQLDLNGLPGRSGVSPRNGADLVFRPDLNAFPVNMTAEDPNDPFCTLITDPPRKGNTGLPLNQAINVEFVTAGIGVTDTAGNPVIAGSPNTKFTFQTRERPVDVFAPRASGAVYFGDTVGVGVIDVNPSRTPYLVGPNPARTPNSVVTIGTGQARTVVRVPVPDLVDMTTDQRPYSSFYTFLCILQSPTIFMGNLYALSASVGGGQITVVDTFTMTSMGKFGTPSPGGIGITAIGTNTGRAAVSNFSANTVTVFDISNVRWYTGASLFSAQATLAGAVTSGASKLVLSDSDFTKVFPHQRADTTSPPGPPIIGTIRVGVSPSVCKITSLAGSMGPSGFPCFSPFLSNNTIVCVLNAGENTADFSELTNLSQSAAISPNLDGVNLSSQPSDVTWSPFSGGTGSYYFYIASIGGTIELFASGFIANQPSVRPESSTNAAPNKIINSITGLVQPSAVQWIPGGNAVGNNNGYTHAVLVAETGENRVQQLAVTAEFPSNLFQTINSNHTAGLGPVDITGDPQSVQFPTPCGPFFTTYFVANAGVGSVRSASYLGGVLDADISVPGVLFVTSWWSR